MRNLGLGLAILILFNGLGIQAQAPARMTRVGFLAPQGRSLPLFDAFRDGMAKLGYVEGRDLVLEPRYAEGHFERFPDLLADLVHQKVDVMAVTGAVTARAAKNNVSGIPVVFSMVVDPIADHVVTDMAHPDGGLTGVTSFDPQQPRRQMELLKELIPGLKRVAVLGDQGVSPALMTGAQEQAKSLGIQVIPIRLSGAEPDLDGAFDTIRREGAGGILVLEEPATGVHATAIAQRAAQERLPTLFPPSRVAAGGLVAYGTSQEEAVSRMAWYVDKILKGARPSDLPVESVTRYVLILNQKTARQIGFTIPSAVLERADRVIP